MASMFLYASEICLHSYPSSAFTNLSSVFTCHIGLRYSRIWRAMSSVVPGSDPTPFSPSAAIPCTSAAPGTWRTRPDLVVGGMSSASGAVDQTCRWTRSLRAHCASPALCHAKGVCVLRSPSIWLPLISCFGVGHSLVWAARL